MAKSANDQAASPAIDAADDAALLARATADRLTQADGRTLKAVIRDLRSRKKALAGGDPKARKPVAQALRRAVDEKRARSGTSGDGKAASSPDAAKDKSAPKPKPAGKTADKADVDGNADARPSPTPEPAAGSAKPTDTQPAKLAKPAKAERDARKAANQSAREARRAERQADRAKAKGNGAKGAAKAGKKPGNAKPAKPAPAADE